jgi:hypothetical protein
MKAHYSALVLAAVLAGCATAKRESGSLARFLVSSLREHGAQILHVDLEQPSIGVPQLYTSWRARKDPGGFTLEFREGTFDYVENQVRSIAGDGVALSTDLLAWDIEHVAHLDLVRLSNGRTQLTCRRIPARAVSHTESHP